MVGHRAEISKPEVGTVYVVIAASLPCIKAVQLMLVMNSSWQMSQRCSCLPSFPPKPGLLAPKLTPPIFQYSNSEPVLPRKGLQFGIPLRDSNWVPQG